MFHFCLLFFLRFFFIFRGVKIKKLSFYYFFSGIENRFLNITIPREAMCDLWFCCFLVFLIFDLQNKLKRAEWGEGKTVLKVTKKKEDRPLDQV